MKDRARQGEREILQILGLSRQRQEHPSSRLPGNTLCVHFIFTGSLSRHSYPLAAAGALPTILDAVWVTQKQVANAKEFSANFSFRFFGQCIPEF